MDCDTRNAAIGIFLIWPVLGLVAWTIIIFICSFILN